MPLSFSDAFWFYSKGDQNAQTAKRLKNVSAAKFVCLRISCRVVSVIPCYNAMLGVPLLSHPVGRGG